ncbi:MAG: hypothetical protein V1725_03840 [archaeon]
MGFFGKLQFWKKHDDLTDIKNDPLFTNPSFAPQFDNDPNQLSFQQGSFPQGQFNQQQNQAGQFGMQPQAQQNPYASGPSFSQQFSQPFGTDLPRAQEHSLTNKDVEILSLKMDAIKSELDSISQRIRRIEMIAEGEKANAGKYW